MYDLHMQNNALGNIETRLSEAMELRRMTAAELSRASGVDKSTLSLILAGKRPNTPAAQIAKLAKALDVSVDYLVGLSDKPDPNQLQIGELLIELTRVARQLTSRRQRALLAAARQYLEESQQLRTDPDLVMDELLDLITEAGGTVSRDRLVELMENEELFAGGFGALADDTASLTPENGEQPTERK